MAMFRRSRRSTPPLRSRQQEIARQEAELRERLDKLERMVTRPAIAQSKSPTQAAKRSGNVNKADKRFEVSLALEGGESSRHIEAPEGRARCAKRDGRVGLFF